MRVKVVQAPTADGNDRPGGPGGAKARPATRDRAERAIMVTYPSTHGVFEERIREVCRIVHEQRRPGLPRRRQPERAGRARAPRRLRRRRLPHQPAQDVRHPARRRRPRHGPHLRGRAPGPLPARPPVVRRPAASGRSARFPRRPWGSASILPIISWAYIALLGGAKACRRDGAGGHPERQLHGEAAGGALPGALQGRARPRGARVHPRPAAGFKKAHRRRPPRTSPSASWTTASTRPPCRSRCLARS